MTHRRRQGSKNPEAWPAAAVFGLASEMTSGVRPKDRPLGWTSVLIPPHAGHASHATYACTLSRTLEQTCEAAALLRSLSAAQPL
jgi:hypothetical protein